MSWVLQIMGFPRGNVTEVDNADQGSICLEGPDA